VIGSQIVKSEEAYRARIKMREPSAEVPVPVVYVLQIYQDTFRHEKPVVGIHTAEPLSRVCG
jgi:hypothetical protein